MKKSKTIVEIRYGGKTYNRIRSDAANTTIVIGSAVDDDWIAPKGDRTMQPHHAKLVVQNETLKLTAGPTLFFRVHAERKAEHVLALGDRIAIGDSEIFVVKANDPVFYAEFDQLEPLGVGEKPPLPLHKTSFIIGSASDADLVLADDVVSASHAKIETKENGEVWISDLKSRNGTRVNGQRLGANARLLFDSDVVSFGANDFRFLSRRVQHVRAKLGSRLLIGLLTLAAALAIWSAFFLLTPDTLRNIRSATALAGIERFDEGLNALDAARTSRGFKQNRRLWNETHESLTTWKTSHGIWQEFKHDLAAARWQDAGECLGRLETSNRQSWNWNPQKTDDLLKEIARARYLFELYQRVNRAIESPTWTIEEQTALERELANVPNETAATTATNDENRVWLQPLKAQLGLRINQMRENERIYGEIVERIANFSVAGAKSFTTMGSYLENAKFESTGHVRLFAHALNKPLVKLRKDLENIKADEAALTALDFENFRRYAIETTPDDCSIAPALSKTYRQLIDYRKQLNLFAEKILEALTLLAAHEAALDRDPIELIEFENQQDVSAALACEILNRHRPPRRGRTAPVDAYDRLFGFEYLWAYMSQGAYIFPDEVVPDELSVCAFRSRLETLHLLYHTLSAIHAEISRTENQAFLVGKVAELKSHIEDILARYEKIRRAFKHLADAEKNSRKGVIARGVYLYLTPHEQITKADWDVIKGYIDRFRAEQKKMADEIDPTKPEEARRIIREILKVGIPGSPSVIKVMNIQ